MKNYVQLWIGGQNDGGMPPTLLQYGFFLGYQEAQDFMQANAWNAGPNMYYFLLSKTALATLISQYPWGPDAQAVLPVNPQQYTQEKDVAHDWGGDAPLWTFDSQDPASVKAQQSAELTRRTVLKKVDYSGAPGLLLALSQLPALAAQLTKAGKLREAGIVTYAYQQVLKNYWSITQAFAYLRDNHIV